MSVASGRNLEMRAIVFCALCFYSSKNHAEYFEYNVNITPGAEPRCTFKTNSERVFSYYCLITNDKLRYMGKVLSASFAIKALTGTTLRMKET